MSRISRSILVATATLAVSGTFASAPANAGVPIACTGDRVIDYPMALPDGPNGEKLVLGYLMQYCSSGKWIAHVAGGRGYFALPTDLAAALTERGALPKSPGIVGAMLRHPITFWVEWFWAIMIGFIAIGSMLASLAKRLDDPRAA